MPASTVFPWRHRPPDLEHPPMRLVLAEMMHDGRYRVSCPMMTGVDLDHGAPAVLEIGRAQILVCSKRMEPTARRYLLIKTRQHFRAASPARITACSGGPGCRARSIRSIPTWRGRGRHGGFRAVARCRPGR
jgi:hypothetical protein